MAESAKWADSVYFLGFLMTLVALIFGLAGFGPESSPPSESNESDLAEQNGVVSRIVVQNAIALSSTAAALLFRTVWILWLSEDVDETLQEKAERQLSASLRLTNQLNEEVVSLRTAVRDARNETEGLAKDSREKYAAFANELSRKTQSEIEETFGELEEKLEPIGEASKDFMKKVSAIELDKDALTKAISEAMRATIDEMSDSINDISSAASAFGSEIASGTNQISESIENMSFAEILEDQIASNLHPMKDVSRAFEEAFAESMEKVRNSIFAVDEEAENFKSALRNNVTELGETNKSATDLQNEIIENGNRLSAAIELARQKIESSLGQFELNEVRDRLIQEIDALAEAVARSREKSSWWWPFGNGK
jgi:uncharacterized protein YoxC